MEQTVGVRHFNVCHVRFHARL